MAKLNLKFVGDGSAFNSNAAYIILGDHSILRDGKAAITPDCASLEELVEQVEFIKKDLDSIIREAKQKFSQ